MSINVWTGECRGWALFSLAGAWPESMRSIFGSLDTACQQLRERDQSAQPVVVELYPFVIHPDKGEDRPLGLRSEAVNACSARFPWASEMCPLCVLVTVAAVRTRMSSRRSQSPCTCGMQAQAQVHGVWEAPEWDVQLCSTSYHALVVCDESRIQEFLNRVTMMSANLRSYATSSLRDIVGALSTNEGRPGPESVIRALSLAIGELELPEWGMYIATHRPTSESGLGKLGPRWRSSELCGWTVDQRRSGQP